MAYIATPSAPTVSGEVTARDYKPSGLSGATSASRYVGATASGVPTSGTFAVGDFVLDQAGKLWICTTAGTPGTWGQAGNMHYRSAWSSSTTYAPNDVVTYSGATYIASTAGSNNTPGPTNNAFYGSGSYSGYTFKINVGAGGAQTIGGFWLKCAAIPSSTTALVDFSDPAGPTANYYRVIMRNDAHIYVEANVMGFGAVSLDISQFALSTGTWYWISFGSDCPGGAFKLLGGAALTTQNNVDNQSSNFGSGSAQHSYTYTLSVGVAPSASSYQTLPSTMLMADLRLGTGDSSFGPFTRHNPIFNPTEGVAVARYAVAEGAGVRTTLADSVASFTLTGSFSVVVDNPIQSSQWTVLPSLLPGTATFAGEVVASDVKAAGLPGATAASRYVGATTSGAPSSGTFAVGDFVIDQTAKIWLCTVAGSPGTWAQLSGGGSSTLAGDTDVAIASPVGGQVLGYSGPLSKWVNQPVAGVAATQVSSQLSSAVSIGSANTFYDGPSVTLSPGTWLLTGALTVGSGDSGAYVTVKLWDGTNVLASDDGGVAFTNDRLSIPLSGVVTITTTTTFKISAAVNTLSAGASIQPTTSANSAGNNASYLNAIQLSGNPVGQQAPAVRCYNSANISVSNAAITAITFDTNRYDQGTSVQQHSTSTNTSRLTCQQAGTYQITGNLRYAGNSGGAQRFAGIRLNGSAIICESDTLPESTANTDVICTTQYVLSVGDYVELIAFQDSGGALNILSVGNYSPEFMMARIDSGPGAVQPNTKVQLDYATPDLAAGVSLPANTWTDVIPNQSFTVDDPNSVVEVAISGELLVLNHTAAAGYWTRYVADSAGSALNKPLSALTMPSGTGTSSAYGNALTGAGLVTLTGLSAGVHTIKLQANTDTAGATYYCQSDATSPVESVRIRVLERKQSVSPPSSTPAPAVRATNSAVESIPNSTWTTVTFDTTSFDQGTSTPQHSTSSNTSRLVCQQAGVYQVDATGIFANNSTGLRGVQFLKNGVQTGAYVLLQPVSVANETSVMVSDKFSLAVGDYLEMQVIQSSGGALNLDQAFFSMARCDTGGTGAVYVPTVQTTNYTALATDTMVVAGANSLTVTLPAASSYGGKAPFVVKNDNVTGTSIAAAGADTIDGASSHPLFAAYASASLVADPATGKWRVI